jgi:hypothetical protein
MMLPKRDPKPLPTPLPPHFLTPIFLKGVQLVPIVLAHMYFLIVSSCIAFVTNTATVLAVALSFVTLSPSLAHSALPVLGGCDSALAVDVLDVTGAFDRVTW